MLMFNFECFQLLLPTGPEATGCRVSFLPSPPPSLGEMPGTGRLGQRGLPLVTPVPPAPAGISTPSAMAEGLGSFPTCKSEYGSNCERSREPCRHCPCWKRGRGQRWCQGGVAARPLSPRRPKASWKNRVPFPPLTTVAAPGTEAVSGLWVEILLSPSGCSLGFWETHGPLWTVV